MEARKSFVNRDNMVVITCPACDEIRRVSAEKFGAKQHNVKVKCACGNVFLIDVEFRRAYRKQVNLSGSYSFGRGEWFSMKVLDISKGGIGFETMSPQDIKPGNSLRVKFTLDDSKRSEIESNAIVKIVRHKFVGCEFRGNMQQEQEKALGFYLMP